MSFFYSLNSSSSSCIDDFNLTLSLNMSINILYGLFNFNSKINNNKKNVTLIIRY